MPIYSVRVKGVVTKEFNVMAECPDDAAELAVNSFWDDEDEAIECYEEVIRIDLAGPRDPE